MLYHIRTRYPLFTANGPGKAGTSAGSTTTILTITKGLDYGWFGQPLMCGQTGTDATEGLDYGWLGQPMVFLTNVS